jgi:sporadic carbohydrate cluster 2OG-Fe(II) oxygenase
MLNFTSKNEEKIAKDFEKSGYIIRDIVDVKSLKDIKKILINSINKKANLEKKIQPDDLLNYFHNKINKKNLNSIRLDIIKDLNQNKKLKELYYLIAKPFLDTLVGNELAMQTKMNLSIQLPRDKSSLLPVHSDVWSGDSAFEIVVWLPLVDCYKTKSMYILKPSKLSKVNSVIYKNKKNSSEKLYQYIKKDINWIDIKYGQVLLFNQTLPHGNRINNEKETRWSFNCRFKGIFTPYRDKKIGEFFEPITMKKISEIAMRYSLPKIK